MLRSRAPDVGGEEKQRRFFTFVRSFDDGACARGRRVQRHYRGGVIRCPRASLVVFVRWRSGIFVFSVPSLCPWRHCLKSSPVGILKCVFRRRRCGSSYCSPYTILHRFFFLFLRSEGREREGRVEGPAGRRRTGSELYLPREASTSLCAEEQTSRVWVAAATNKARRACPSPLDQRALIYSFFVFKRSKGTNATYQDGMAGDGFWRLKVSNFVPSPLGKGSQTVDRRTYLLN